MATGFNVRVGDADREAVAAQLREHYADGRLTLDELNERLDQVFAAKTRADLNTVLRDLPHAPWQTAGGPQRATQPSGTGWDQRDTGRSRGPFAAFAPLMGLVWVFIVVGGVFLFGLGGGGRPIAIALFIAALTLLRRLFGIGRRRGYGGPRGRRGRRCGFLLLPPGFRAGPARLIVEVMQPAWRIREPDDEAIRRSNRNGGRRPWRGAAARADGTGMARA